MRQLFSLSDLSDNILDLNPIVDEGSITYTGGVSIALTICDGLGTQFQAECSTRHYSRVWGNEALSL